ncbi:SRPBCC domain-containing protein [Nocardia bovistercoris]|uniref:SRPBCC domain-containing protein n=1 Tax=Nocardia bovistercoris TaxID=2785916 RepID=A0A931N2D1_9NOCA|nr:SRPBCC domain-containing protein [Nocardia bovistercoris]MBH0776617.1 SRPBCC domain-containing protein [Nocardia bovistercoris]
MNNTTDRWPPGLTPPECAVHARNEIFTTVAAEELWPVLVAATAWPTWYSNSRAVVVPGGRDLSDGVTFRWTTFGLRVSSTVREFVPARRLAWDGAALGSTGYHRWELTPTEDGGCHVVTEEVQRGTAARLLAPAMRRGLHRQHQRWLEALVETAVRRSA